MKKHYQTLGLNEGASQKEIQTAYERLSKELDPRNNDNQEFFVEEYQKVQEAYEALSNSSILANDRGLNLNSTKKITKEKRNKETPINEKEPKPVKNLKGYFVLIFFILVGLGPTLVVHYFYSQGYMHWYAEITKTEFLEMGFFKKFSVCFKETLNLDLYYYRNYFLFIFIYIAILLIFRLFQKKATTQRDSKILKSEKQIQVSSGGEKQYKPNPKEALEKLRKYKELLDLNVITKEEYTNYVKEYRSMLLKDIDKE
jgi:short subunit fatty acids transporter